MDGRKARGMYGHRTMPGEVWSRKYPGLVLMASGRLKKHTTWFDPRLGRERSANQYYHETSCCVCGKSMIQADGNSVRGAKPTCSKDCWKAVRSKQVGHKRSKNGAGSYILVKMPSHHRANKRTGETLEHIIVYEKVLGREIKNGEIVHHINCVKDDNRPENLCLFKNTKAHMLAHASLNMCVDALMKAGFLMFDRDENTYKVNENVRLAKV